MPDRDVAGVHFAGQHAFGKKDVGDLLLLDRPGAVTSRALPWFESYVEQEWAADVAAKYGLTRIL